MKAFLIILVAISAVTAENLCTPGAFFKLDCNTCACSNDGKSAACTDMTCPSEGNANVNDINTIQAHQYCVPRSIFSPDNCNICRCSKDGTKAVCTMKVCQNEEVKSLKSLYCQPRSIFSPDNCNLCRCSKDGTKAVCTMKVCSDVEETNKICEPNSQFNDYCNVCSCSADGTSLACTKMYCDKDIWNQDGSLKIVMQTKNAIVKDEKQVCTPNSQFKEQCNTCICSNDGLSKTCTMMTCNSNGRDVDSKNHLSGSRICEPGKAYSPDGCNTCICNQDGTQSACTLKLCLSSLASVYKATESKKWGPLYKQGDVCTPGKTFYSECNQCVCTGSGRSAFCTLMFCQDKSIRN